MKIKIFDTTKRNVEEDINKFFAEYDVATDRVMIRKDEIIYPYFEKGERTYGMTIDSAIETLGGTIEKQQAMLMEAMEARRFFDVQLGLKQGGKGRRDILDDQRMQHNKRVEEAETHIKIVRKMIRDLQDGQLDLG